MRLITLQAMPSCFSYEDGPELSRRQRAPGQAIRSPWPKRLSEAGREALAARRAVWRQRSAAAW